MTCRSAACGCGQPAPHFNPNYEEDAPGYSIRTNMDYGPGGRPVPGSEHVTAPATSPVFGAAMSYPQIGDGPLEAMTADPEDSIRFGFGESGAGVVVGYFCHPDFPGEMVHTCGSTMHEHGWLDSLNITVCPSDFGPFGGQRVTDAGRRALGRQLQPPPPEESALPDPKVWLLTLEDYAGAPLGTMVAGVVFGTAGYYLKTPTDWVWVVRDIHLPYSDAMMAGTTTRRVIRWGPGEPGE